eukprot:jgi/Ulvmu1/10178/UM006_0134.1
MLKQFAAWQTKRTFTHAVPDGTKSKLSELSRGLIKVKVSSRDPSDAQSQGLSSSRASPPSGPQGYHSLAPVSRSTGEAVQRASNSDGAILVTFWLTFQAEFGQRICIVGNCPGLGNWQHKAAPEMQWSDGHKWNVTVEVPAGHVVEYKYVVLQPDGLTALQWQQGNNAVLAILPGESRLEVQDNWYDPAASAVVPSGGQRTTRSDRLALWANQMNGSVGKLRDELRSTRMNVFEAQQGMKDALEQVQVTQDTLAQQVELNDELADKMVAMQEKNRNMRLQLLESQTLFKEVMEEAREIILASVEPEGYTTDDDRLLLGRDGSSGSPHAAAAAAAAEADVDTAADVDAGWSSGEGEGSEGEAAEREREWWEEEREEAEGEGEDAVAGAYVPEEAAEGGLEADWRNAEAGGSADQVQEEGWRGAAEAATSSGYGSDVDGGVVEEEYTSEEEAVGDSEGGSEQWSEESVWGSASDGERSWSEGEEEEVPSPAGSVAESDSEAESEGESERGGWPPRLEVMEAVADREGTGERWRSEPAEARRSIDDGADARSAGAVRVGEPDAARRSREQWASRDRRDEGGYERWDVGRDGSETGGHAGQGAGERWQAAAAVDVPRTGWKRAPGSAAERLQVVGEVRPPPDAAVPRGGAEGGGLPGSGGGERQEFAAQRPLVDELMVQAGGDDEPAVAHARRNGNGRRSVARPRRDSLERSVEQDSMRVTGSARRSARPEAARMPQVARVLRKVPATEAAGALLEAQVRVEAGLDGDSSGEDVQWLTEQAESLLSVFEQLESDVTEADQAIGRAISTDV